MIKQNIFRQRREHLLANLGGTALVIPSAGLVTHHADCDYPFRQNSDFWYLTGFDEPNSLALLLPYRPTGEKYVLFVLPKEAGAEVWNGYRCGVQGAMRDFEADIAHSIDDLPILLSKYLKGAEKIAFRVGKHPKVEPLILRIWSEQLDDSAKNGQTHSSLISPCPLIHELRLVKDSHEINRIREAARISAGAHELARNVVHPGMNERQLQGEIEQYFLKHGARGPAYNSIVAGGDNACVLHYTANKSNLNDGDLVLIDAGCSLQDYYNGDITRTFPVNGTFTSEQKALYEVVLNAQEKAIKEVSPGGNAENVHITAARALILGLLDLGLLKGQVDSILEQELYKHLYMHRTGHWLGLDVHDVGAYRLGERPIDLQSGMVLTVEPGLYISDRLPVPKGQPVIDERWKGIGIRIEDDVLVGKNGPEVLTSLALKDIDSIQK